MNRIINISVMILLLTATIGISVTKHYCGDTLKSIAINMTPDHCCEEDQEPMGCCHNESEDYALDDELKVQYEEHKLSQLVPIDLIIILKDHNFHNYYISERKLYVPTKSPP